MTLGVIEGCYADTPQTPKSEDIHVMVKKSKSQAER